MATCASLWGIKATYFWGGLFLLNPIHPPGPWESVNQPGPDPGLIHPALHLNPLRRHTPGKKIKLFAHYLQIVWSSRIVFKQFESSHKVCTNNLEFT